MMILTRTRLAAGGTVAGLGVLAAVALGAGSNDPAKPAPQPAATPPIVRTVVVHRTVRVVKREKPKAPPKAAPPAPAVQVAPVQVAQVQPAAVPQPVRQTQPLKTKTSGAASGENEREHENGDGEREEADD